VVEHVGRDKVEVARVPCELAVELWHHVAEVAQLVDQRRARVMTLEPAWILLSEMHVAVQRVRGSGVK
jgi:hypothetical protein